jgi:hypothetical protein
MPPESLRSSTAALYISAIAVSRDCEVAPRTSTRVGPAVVAVVEGGGGAVVVVVATVVVVEVVVGSADPTVDEQAAATSAIGSSKKMRRRSGFTARNGIPAPGVFGVNRSRWLRRYADCPPSEWLLSCGLW